MRSYIKIDGPPVLKAIGALEKVALDMPEVTIVDTVIVPGISHDVSHDIGASSVQKKDLGSLGLYPGGGMRRYRGPPNVPVPVERTGSLISDAGERLGHYDFFFEWVKEPTLSQLNELIGRIDEALTPLESWYTIFTEKD